MAACVKRRRIGIILASMDIEYAHETLLGIMEQAKLDGYELYIFNTYVGADEWMKHNVGEYKLYELANYKEFDGIILFANLIQGHATYDQVIKAIKMSQVPTICIDTKIDGLCEVGIENYSGMKMIVDHLIEHHGFTKIAYISGQDFNSDSKERLQAYCDAMREHDLPIDEKSIYKGIFSLDSGKLTANKILEEGKELPEAIVCATDSIALGVRSVFTEHGIKIPEQVALAGFDNQFEARYSAPRITTVDRNQRQVGRAAMKKLSEHLRNGKPLVSENFKTVPIFAESCGCKLEQPVDVNFIGQKYFDMRDHYEEYLYENNMMIESLNDSRNFEELLEHLKPHIVQIKCDRFYLCLDKVLTENLRYIGRKHGNITFVDEYTGDGYPEVMSVPLSYVDGEFGECEDFKSKQMIPEPDDSECEENLWIFAPLHFKDQCMGYVLIKNSGFAFESPMFRTWLNNLSNGLENLRKQAKLQSVLERLENMYVTDSLTGLYNRFGFSHFAGESFKDCIKKQKYFMILFADLDGLKRINDEYGHEKGDLAICAVADALKMACTGEEICARFGGDEYVVYAEDCTREEAEAFCERFLKRIEVCNETMGVPFEIGASYGYEIICPREGDIIDSYIDMADTRMYIQKKQKKAERKA